MVTFFHHAEFDRDLKKLSKRFRTLPEDLEVLKKVLVALPHPSPPTTYRIAGVGFTDPPIFLVKRFACRALKGQGADTGLRLVLAWREVESQIDLIELYFKADRAVEDFERMRKLYG